MNNDFEILDQRKKGVPSYETRFPNDALIAVNKTMFTIFSKAVDKLGITEDRSAELIEFVKKKR